MCILALISWTFAENSPNNGYINLGEIYDKNCLQELHRDLVYFYPFRYNSEKNICYNIEDFFSLKRRHPITQRIFLVKISYQKKILIFRSPVLYDITCMVPVFDSPHIPKSISVEPLYDFCIVIPHLDPIVRGKSLEIACTSSKNIVLMGGKLGKNLDTLASLFERYLRYMQYPSEKIIKTFCEDISEVFQLLTETEVISTEMLCCITCNSDVVNTIQKYIKTCRRFSSFFPQKMIYLLT